MQLQPNSLFRFLNFNIAFEPGQTTAQAQRQSEQINRLTAVSVIFLPISFLTGFFGMNFGWMANHLGGLTVFLGLGVFLPFANVGMTILWFRRRRLL